MYIYIYIYTYMYIRHSSAQHITFMHSYHTLSCVTRMMYIYTCIYVYGYVYTYILYMYVSHV